MSKKDVPAIVSAMGVLMSLLDGLVKVVRAAGGTMGDLYWLVTPEGEGLLVKIGRLVAEARRIFSVNRAQLFDPVKFLGPGWSIEEQDKRALALTELDLTQVRLANVLKERETAITGGEKLSRLKKAGYIRLDAKVFQILWENQALIPKSWKGSIVDFDGTVLRHPSGNRCVLALYWRDGQWYLRYNWLSNAWDISGPSAVLVAA